METVRYQRPSGSRPRASTPAARPPSASASARPPQRLGRRLRLSRGVGPSRRQRIAQVVEAPFHLVPLGFLVGEGREAAGAPVDDVLAPVDQALLVEADEDLPDGPAEPRIQGEAGPVPVAGATDGLELVQDGSAGLLDELPGRAPRRPPGPGRPGSFPPSPGGAPPRSAWRCRRGPCPGAQREARPCILRHRIRTSWIVLFRPCPMWRTAVTLGGGITMT